MTIEKVVSSKGYDNGGAVINPNSLKIPPTTTQKVAGDTTHDLTAASGYFIGRFDDYTYYTA